MALDDMPTQDREAAAADPFGIAPLSRRQTVTGGLGVISGAVIGGTLLSGCGGDETAATGGAASAIVVAGRTASAGPMALGAAASAAPILPLLPGGEGDAFQKLMAYDPEADPNAPYFRSVVPIATRIAPFAATQAHPALDARAGAATLATTNRSIPREAPDVWRAVRHAAMPAGGVQVSRRLGVHDIVVQWGGTGVIPNPAMTDTAHRNGALCLGTIWQPDARMFNGSVVPVERVAEKMVALARYFGFDGYFVNHEMGSQADKEQVATLIATMRSAARRARLTPFHIQHYNGHTDLDSLFAIPYGSDPAASTVMPDQGWSGYGGPGGCCAGWSVNPATLAGQTAAFRRTKYDVYYGFQLYPGPGFLGAAAPRVVTPNTGAATNGGLQLYSIDDGFLNLWRARQSGRGAAFLGAEVDIPTIERMVYSGQTQNPAMDNTPSAAQQAVYDSGKTTWGDFSYYRLSEWATTNDTFARFSPDQADLPITYGVANFIAERSVVGAMPFETHFNEGEGKGFFVEGQQVSDTGWFNLGIQDVLPTWQWWRAPFAGLTDRTRNASGLLEVGFDTGSAYDGGSSLRVRGTLQPSSATRVHLFKTDIPVVATAGSPAMEVTTRGSAADRERTRIGLIFADQPGQPEWVPLPAGSAAPGGSGWTLSRIDLRRFSGRRIASILLGFEATGNASQAFDLRFGRLSIADRAAAAPSAPGAVTLDRRVVDATTGVVGIGLKWDGAGRYDVFRIADGSGARTWIGRVDGKAFYSPTALPVGTASAVLEVQAIGVGGRGAAVRVQV